MFKCDTPGQVTLNTCQFLNAWLLLKNCSWNISQDFVGFHGRASTLNTHKTQIGTWFAVNQSSSENREKAVFMLECSLVCRKYDFTQMTKLMAQFIFLSQ